MKNEKFWSMTKKKSSEILADENREISSLKANLGKFYTECQKIFRKKISALGPTLALYAHVED